MQNLYYPDPMQVKYLHNETYLGGIAYHDFIIDGSGAGAIPIVSILRDSGAPEDVTIVEFDWVDLNEMILYGKAL